MEILDKSISQFADKGWHNIMNPDRPEFLAAQSEHLIKKNSIVENVNLFERINNTSNLFRKYLLDKRIKNIVERLAKFKIMGLMTHVIFKHAKTKYAPMGWEPHQDNSYAKMNIGNYITTNLFLNHASREKWLLISFSR